MNKHKKLLFLSSDVEGPKFAVIFVLYPEKEPQ